MYPINKLLQKIWLVQKKNILPIELFGCLYEFLPELSIFSLTQVFHSQCHL